MPHSEAYNMWHEMFVSDLPILEKILRPIIVYIFLIVGLRLAGKRELAQLNPFDLIVLLTLSNTVQNAIIGNDNSVTGGVIGAISLLVCNYLVVQTIFRHRRLGRIIAGRRDCLIKDGKVLKDHLNHELMTRAELAAAAHKQGIDTMEEIESAILEANGTITFVKKTPTIDDHRHQDLCSRIEQLSKEIAALKPQ